MFSTMYFVPRPPFPDRPIAVSAWQSQSLNTTLPVSLSAVQRRTFGGLVFVHLFDPISHPEDLQDLPEVPGFRWVLGLWPELPWRLWRLHCSWRNERYDEESEYPNPFDGDPITMACEADRVVVNDYDARLEICADRVFIWDYGDHGLGSRMIPLVQGLTGWALYDPDNERLVHEPVTCADCGLEYELFGNHHGGCPRCRSIHISAAG